MDKYYVTYQDIHRTVRKLAGMIRDSGFTPDLIVAIGTGGFVPARILKTYLNLPILTVGIAYYDLSNRPAATPQMIQWIDEVRKKLTGKKVLLVDEVDDSRTTLEYCLRELLKYKPEEVAVAVIHNKDKEKRGSFPAEVKRYFPGEQVGDRWIAYPWDAIDIDQHDRISRVERKGEQK